MGEFKGFMKYDRQLLSELSLADRLSDHEAFQQRFIKEDASVRGAHCTDCGTPFCQAGQSYGRETIECPIGNYIPEWDDLAYHQDFKAAYERLRGMNSFPEFTGKVCPAPYEQSCAMKINRKSMTIKGIKHTTIDEAYENEWVHPAYLEDYKDQRVAIAGSDPAGLTTTEELNFRGYRVAVYEKAHEPGGLLMYGILNMKLDKDVIRRHVSLMKDTGVLFKAGVEIGVDVSREALKENYDTIILYTGAQNARNLPLEGRMDFGIHFTMNYLTGQAQYLNGEIESLSITAKDKNIIVIGTGDTDADCVATALRENCKSVVQFNKYTKQSEEITLGSNTSWPLAMPVFKIDCEHKEYEAKFGREPRTYDVQAVHYDVDELGNVKSLYTQILKETPDGIVVKDRPERFWPADLVLLSIGFVGTGTTVPYAFDIHAERNKIVANSTNRQTSHTKVFAAGDARWGQSLVVWAIKRSCEVAHSVDQYLSEEVLV